jgi:hypothetical protein
MSSKLDYLKKYASSKGSGNAAELLKKRLLKSLTKEHDSAKPKTQFIHDDDDGEEHVLTIGGKKKN